MRVAYITAGAGGTLCGNCLSDNALAAAMRKLGHDVILLPIYTPIRTDEPDVSEQRVFLGGVNIYLQQRYRLFRKLPRFLDRVLDHPALLRQVSKYAVKTRPEELGALTLATFEGEAGPLGKEIERLIDGLRGLRPEIVHLTNSMLVGLAEPIRRELGIPVVCSLQGEDVYLKGLPEPFQSQCLETLAENAAHVDQFIAPSRDHARALGPWVNRPAEDIWVVYPGISLEGLSPGPPRGGRKFSIGYVARIAPEKGLELLTRAFAGLSAKADASLRVAGWLSPEHDASFNRELQAFMEAEGLADRWQVQRDVPRLAKAALLRDIDVLSVPTTYGASKGLYVLEAWACGVPVVQPRIGIFPELIEPTGGGLLFEPGSIDQLQAALEWLMDDPAEAARMGERGRSAVLKRFTAERMARETVDVYSSLVT